MQLARAKDSGPKFEQFFSTLYAERWPALRAALLGDTRKHILDNPFGLDKYSLDEASLAPVRALNLEPGQRVADLCASPGGKLLAGILSVQGAAEWWANDLSPARVTRLKAVLHDCLPPEVLHNVHVSLGDGSRWGLRYAEEFDRVLVDAPCSGERHLLASPAELARWSEKGSKRLSVRQHALLCAAVDSLRVSGRAVYSTCSISPYENDAVVAKILKSRAGRVRSVAYADAELEGETTEYGQIFLPDRGRGGAGPIYVAVVERV